MSEVRELMLSDIANIVTGSTPSTYIPEYWNGNIPFYSPGDIKSSVSIKTANKTVSTAGAKSGRTVIIGSIMVTCIGSIGKMAVCGKEGITNQQINTLILKAGYDSLYVYYLILSNVNRLIQFAPQTTIPIINKTEFGKFVFSFHEYDKQQKIAHILTTIDNLIDKTQALIDKYTAIKQGMMGDLFTHGIDLSGTPDTNPNYGQLRPPYEEAPELYKQTELGWVPKEWEVASANDICEAVIDCKNRTPPETDDGYVVLKTFNIKNGQLKYDRLTYTDVESYAVWTARGEPEAGDIVITREAPIGESFLIEVGMPKVCLGQRMMLYRPDTQAMKASYMYYMTRSNILQRRLIELAGGSTVGHVRVGDIRDLLFFVPKMDEQKIIAIKLETIDSQLKEYEAYIKKLNFQKKGLMQDLLTGKVRVTND